MKEIIGDYKQFIAEITSGLVRLGVERKEVSMMDHICYRVETMERYEELRGRLKHHGVLLGENMVNGRLIATFELDTYIEASGWIVPYLELPAPKEGSSYKEGLEHAEFVVIGSLSRFMDRHKNLLFSPGGLTKTINPEAGVKAEGISVKFHEQQLGAVVRIERNLPESKSL